MNRQFCFVCNNLIRKNPLYIGQGFYRHKSKCNPLSENYKKFEQEKQNQEYEERVLKFDEGRDFIKEMNDERINSRTV
jgi:hypothetical protein